VDGEYAFSTLRYNLLVKMVFRIVNLPNHFSLVRCEDNVDFLVELEKKCELQTIICAAKRTHLKSWSDFLEEEDLLRS